MPRRRGGRDHARHLQTEAATTAAAGAFLADSQSQDSGGGGGGGSGHSSSSSSSFSDWKDELDDEPRELYRQLGLALYRATSQEEMSAAMRGLQQFEREHRHAAAATQQAAAAAAGGGSREDPEQAFKKMAMHYYREDGLGHGLDGRGAARTLDLLKRERRRGAKANGSTM
jgi:hypothetical protein